MHTGRQVQKTGKSRQKYLGLVVGVGSVGTLEFATKVLERLEGIWCLVSECSLRGVRCGVRRQYLRVRFVSPVVSEQPGASQNYLLTQEQDFRRRLAHALPLVLSHCHFLSIPSPQQGWPWRTTLHDFHSNIPPIRDRPKMDKRFPNPIRTPRYQRGSSPPLVLTYYRQGSSPRVSAPCTSRHLVMALHGTE